jgi:hypothetical protein
VGLFGTPQCGTDSSEWKSILDKIQHCIASEGGSRQSPVFGPEYELFIAIQRDFENLLTTRKIPGREIYVSSWYELKPVEGIGKVRFPSLSISGLS